MPLRGSACENVLKAIRSIIRSIDIQSKILHLSFGLTGPQLTALKEIHLQGVTTTSALANYISTSQSTATIIIDRLVENDLVVRTRDTEDRRKWFISLTAQGEKTIKDSPPLLQSEFINRFEQLHTWEQNQILASLQHVVAMLNTG